MSKEMKWVLSVCRYDVLLVFLIEGKHGRKTKPSQATGAGSIAPDFPVAPPSP